GAHQTGLPRAAHAGDERDAAAQQVAACEPRARWDLAFLPSGVAETEGALVTIAPPFQLVGLALRLCFWGLGFCLRPRGARGRPLRSRASSPCPPGRAGEEEDRAGTDLGRGRGREVLPPLGAGRGVVLARLGRPVLPPLEALGVAAGGAPG